MWVGGSGARGGVVDEGRGGGRGAPYLCMYVHTCISMHTFFHLQKSNTKFCASCVNFHQKLDCACMNKMAKPIVSSKDLLMSPK